MNWHFATDEEIERAERAVFPPASKVSITKNRSGRFSVRGGSVRQGGEVFDLAFGERIQILSEGVQGDWVCEVVQLTVALPGRYWGDLKPGTRLAVLPQEPASDVHGDDPPSE